MTPIEADLLVFLAGGVATILGWVAVRQEMWGRKVVRLETKLENGITNQIGELQKNLHQLHEEFREHSNGEETRIISAFTMLSNAGHGRRR